MVLPLDVTLQLRAVEVHGPQVTRAVPLCLIVEVRRCGVAALAAGSDRNGAHAVTELDYGHEAVAAGSINLLGAAIGTRTKGSERAPACRGERHGDTWTGITEW